MRSTILTVLSLSVGIFAVLALSACEIPQKWKDPAYFGPDENLGKETNGSGTGYETWKYDW